MGGGAPGRRRALPWRRQWRPRSQRGGSAAVEVASTRLLLGIVAVSPPYYPPSSALIIDENSLQVGKLLIISEKDIEGLDSAERYLLDLVPPRMVEVYRGDLKGMDLVNGSHAERVRFRLLEFLEAYGP